MPRLDARAGEEGVVSKLKILAIAVLSIVISGAAYSAPRGGGRGHGGGGGHFGGGGHCGGGHVGGGMRGGGAHFGGAHFGGGHFGGARFGGGGARHFGGRSFGARAGISRSAGRTGFSGNRSFAVHNPAGVRTAVANGNQNRNAALRARAVHNALNSRSVARALHNPGALRNPGTRALIAASAATAGWHNRHGGGGWWRHGNGGYGWVGPLFWPFAYYDMYDYTMWGGDDPSFWWYGYNDIYAGIFAPYGYDDLSGYLPSGTGNNPGSNPGAAAPAANSAPDELSQMCGDASRDIAGLPIDQIQKAIQPNDAQRAALDDLANASVKAAQDIKAACPTSISLTAPGRLGAMQARIEAMIAAVGTVQPALDKFYGLLNDEQKARLNAIGQDQQDKNAAQSRPGSMALSCSATQPAATDWPGTEIDAMVRPTDAQRASLTALQDAS